MSTNSNKPVPVITIQLIKLGAYLLHRAKMRFTVASDRKKNNEIKVEKQIFEKTISLNLKDLDQRLLYEDHIREPENIFTYTALARAGLCKTFIDIGANYGHDAILLEKEYDKIVLIEPNPSAATILMQMFKDKKNVFVINAAVVGENSPKELLLKVPKDSSALASIVDSPLMRDDVDTFVCKGMTLKECVETNDLSSSYIKIDVEGGEYEILSESADEIMESRAIVGFEALSREFAIKCVALLKGYTYYYAKFDFLDDSGSLIKSPFKLLLSLFGINSSISIYKVYGNDFTLAPDNFSQVYCVPNEKELQFEKAIKTLVTKSPKIDCSKFEY